ncbi:MAG: iron-containing alcohol dehydrogenase [Turicibacter sp.]|nr:iron-containing alcohol dehydrogenase [Turicibacter sp.]
MATRYFFVPQINLLGAGCLNDFGPEVVGLGYQKALVVSDPFLAEIGIVAKVTDQLAANGIPFTLFTETTENPTCAQVDAGLAILKAEGCDFVVSIGGGSPQDCASAIAVLATNGGDIRDYEGIHMSKKPCLPVVAINTTAGTSAEVTINYVITDEDRGVKMVMVDKNSIAKMSVSDPELMIGKPPALTAAVGVDLLTHAIECLVTLGAYTVSDPLALQAVKTVFEFLPRAVKDGNDLEAREQLSYANFIVGMAFSNAGLGYVHAMAHQLGGIYDLPHGVCNAMLLPVVQRENAKHVPERFCLIAEALGFDCGAATPVECADFVIDKIIALCEEVGIPKSLKELGIENPDLDRLADAALVDVCAGGNPFAPTKEETIDMFKAIV